MIKHDTLITVLTVLHNSDEKIMKLVRNKSKITNNSITNLRDVRKYI